MFRMRSFSEMVLYDICCLLQRKEPANINRYTNIYILPLNDLRLTYTEIKPISYLLQEMRAKKKEYEEDGITSDSICEIKVCGGYVFRKDYNLLIKKNCRNAKNMLTFLETHFVSKAERQIKKIKIDKRRKINRSYKYE